MYKLQVLQPHVHEGKRLYAGEIIEIESATEAEKLLRKVGHNFKFFRMFPGSALPSVAAMDADAEKAAMEKAEAEAAAKLMADKAAADQAAAEAAQASVEQAAAEKPSKKAK